MSTYEGNAADLGRERRGWFLGHFMPGGMPLHSEEVEIKWAEHKAGEERGSWTVSASAHTISILLRGRFVLLFADGERTLEREGDFVYWKPGVEHGWRVEEDTTILTVRWPSRAE